MTNSDRIAGSSGMKIIDDTSVHNGVWDYFIPREDTVLNVCTGVNDNGVAVDFKTLQNWDGTLKSTDYCIAPQGWKITEIDLTSGSIQIF